MRPASEVTFPVASRAQGGWKHGLSWQEAAGALSWSRGESFREQKGAQCAGCRGNGGLQLSAGAGTLLGLEEEGPRLVTVCDEGDGGGSGWFLAELTVLCRLVLPLLRGAMMGLWKVSPVLPHRQWCLGRCSAICLHKLSSCGLTPWALVSSLVKWVKSSRCL